MRRLIAALAVLLLTGCGDAPPSAVVPADATIYVGLDESEAERLLAATSRADVDFERDVGPWLGERAAYFVRTPGEYGLVFDAEDDEAAEAFARKVTATGPLRASAVIDGRLVIASARDLLRAANAAADSGSLREARLDVSGEDDDDPPDILIATEEPRAFAAGLERYDVLPHDLPLPVEALAGDGPLTARVWDDLVELKGLAPVADAAPGLDDVPGAASLAFASADLGADIALAADRPEYRRLEDRWGIDLERALLPHLGAGRFFVQGRGSRLLAETSDEDALRQEAISLGRRLGPKRADLNLERPGAEERFLQLSVRDFYLEIQSGRVRLDVGETPGGVAEDLDDTPRYRDARRRLGGAPTLLVERSSGYLAARRDGGTLTIVRR